MRPFPAGRGGKWQISTGGGWRVVWSNNGRELFYETPDAHIMAVDYRAKGNSFVPGKPRLWCDTQISNARFDNLALAPDGKRFAVFPMPEAAGLEKGSVHVTFLLKFLDQAEAEDSINYAPRSTDSYASARVKLHSMEASRMVAFRSDVSRSTHELSS